MIACQGGIGGAIVASALVGMTAANQSSHTPSDHALIDMALAAGGFEVVGSISATGNTRLFNAGLLRQHETHQAWFASGGYEMSGRIVQRETPTPRTAYVIVEANVLIPAARNPDLDGSGVVDTHDLILAITEFGATGSASAAAKADLNTDGVVDDRDLQIIIDAWTDQR